MFTVGLSLAFFSLSELSSFHFLTSTQRCAACPSFFNKQTINHRLKERSRHLNALAVRLTDKVGMFETTKAGVCERVCFRGISFDGCAILSLAAQQ